MVNKEESVIIKKMKIKDLNPAPYNPRTSTQKQEDNLKASLEKFGVVEPIIYNKQTGNIVGGHFRVRELKKLGHKEVDCVIVDLNVEDEKELNIRLNANTGAWDWDELANNWDAKDLEDWGLDGFPFDTEPEQLEAVEDDYEQPEEIKTDIVLGDLFTFSKDGKELHRLLCGDSTKTDDVERLMDGKKADMVFTDPPYGIGIDGQKKSTAKNPKHNRKGHEFRSWDNHRPDAMVINYILSLKIPTAIFGGNYFADLLPPTKGWIYWGKGQDGDLTMSDGELCWTSLDKPLRAVTVNRGKLHGSVHPTQKPLDVVTFCLKYLGEENKVLDLFLGSGSTMVACHQLQRKCYGMELDPKYCQVIVDRMKKLDPEIIVEMEQRGNSDA